MKKTLQNEDVNIDDGVTAQPLPVMPGTEHPRSLGDMLRDAERASAGAADAATVAPGSGEPGARQARPARKASRAQTRRFARERALQALYQWDVSAGQSSDIRRQFLTDQDMSRVDVAYFEQLFNGVSHNPQAVDDALALGLDRPIEELDPIERSVLRIAAYELSECPDIPARVVINEGIEITKRFGADNGHRYVNGVLDKVAGRLRPLEMRRS